MRVHHLVAPLAVSLLAACAAPQTMTVSGGQVAGGGAPPAGSPAAATPSSASPTPAVGGATAMNCVPGVWEVDGPSLVATFVTPGNPEYVGGSYVLTFREDLTFSAVADDLTFKISSADGFVDVHRSWTEEGSWGAPMPGTTFNDVLLALGTRVDTSGEDMTLSLGLPDESSLLAVQGLSYAAGEAYGMVNGQFRTPALDETGEAISAVGNVQCDEGTMTLVVDDAGWSGPFTLRRADGS